MSTNLSQKIALVLIICAVAGVEVSYHLSLESRFSVIEEKLQQTNTTLAQMQDSIDSLTASKTQSVSDLNKQLATLQVAFQSSVEPLGKTSQAQADALTQLRIQIAALQQAQGSQQDAQKRLSDYISQLEESVKKARAEAESATKTAPAASAPATAAPAAASVAAPVNLLPPPVATTDLMSSPGAVAHGGLIEPPAASDAESAPASAPARKAVPVAATASSISGVDLRPAEPAAAMDTTKARRALPVGASLSSQD